MPLLLVQSLSFTKDRRINHLASEKCAFCLQHSSVSLPVTGFGAFNEVKAESGTLSAIKVAVGLTANRIGQVSVYMTIQPAYPGKPG